MGALDGKVALVTGASRSLGAAQARLLNREGAHVVLCDLLDERGRLLAEELSTSGPRCMYLHLDVSSSQEWERVAAETERHLGQIDVLVNNAGINVRNTVRDLKEEDWNRVIAVNLTGPFHGIRAVVPAMQRAGGGSIVNIGSVAGLTGSPSAAYTSTKWGLRGLTRTAALDLASLRIRVNTVCPGLVVTELNEGQPYIEPMSKGTPLGRSGESDEIAQAVLFLASEQSSYITGTDLAVDGGVAIGRFRP